MPAEDAQLQAVDGDTDRYDAELRPELMRRAIAEIQDAGIEVDIWKIEGVDERSDCEMLVDQARSGGRDGVVCVVLGRGARRREGRPLAAARPHRSTASSASRSAARSGGTRSRPTSTARSSAQPAPRKIAENYLRFVKVYERAEGTRSALT